MTRKIMVLDPDLAVTLTGLVFTTQDDNSF